MEVLLLLLYGILLGYAVVKIKFIRRSRIRTMPLLFLFGLHVAAGFLHTLIAWYYYPEHGDIWMYFQFSSIQTYRLFNDFDLFWKFNSDWDSFSHNAVILIHVLLDPLSRNNLYINTLLFSFPVFLGAIALFRTFRHRFPDDPLAAFSVIVLPSILFWTSCIHREAVLYMLIGFLLYNIHRLLYNGFTWKRTIYSVVFFLLIVWIRTAAAILLLPAIFCWLFGERPRLRKSLALFGVIATISLLLTPNFQHLPATIARHQHEFLVLQGNSRLDLPALNGSWGSLFRILPIAIKNGFFEPLPGSGGQPIYLLFSLELLLIWGTVVFALVHNYRNRRNLGRLTKDSILNPFNWFCFLFAISGMLIIGVMIPFAGAIVRYRSIYLPFLLVPFLHSLRTLPLYQALNHRLYSYLSHRL
ncbi:MAG TPA: hypothetical protein VHE34_10665 [Puia sp.]|uniref:hypothetical protein n=1 Tax=Puia sp. TaxID=2045100 RepID=UPI002C6A98B6|nr:hypothetical protein [Puia sp.]HVU95678.1 hypothetical protein [Puia sp.]